MMLLDYYFCFMKKLIYNLIAFLFITIPFVLDAQSNNTKDSLLLQLKTAKPDTNKVLLLIKIGNVLEGVNNDSSLLIYNQANDLSKELSWMLGQIKYCTNASYALELMGKLDTALLINLQSVELAKKYPNKILLAKCLGNVGASYLHMKNFEKAIDYTLQAATILEISNDFTSLAVLYSNLSNIYNDLKQYDKALQAINKSIAICDKGFCKDNQDIVSLVNKGNTLNDLKRYQESLKCYKIAKEKALQVGNLYIAAIACGNMADNYMKMGRYDLLTDCATEHLKIAKQYNNNEILSMANMNKAFACFYSHQLIEAEVFGSEAVRYALIDTLPERLAQIYKGLASIEYALGKMKEGDKCTKLADRYADKIFNEKMATNVQELETKYDVAKKDLSIKQQTLEANRQFWIIMLLIFVIVAAITISIIGYNALKQKKRIEQYEALAEERQRIAADMHDDMGAGISRIRFLGEKIKTGLPNEKLNIDIETMISLSDNLVDKMNEIIWTLNTGDEPLIEVLYYIRSQCSQLVNEAGIDFEGNISEDLPTIRYTAAQKRNLYLVIKEAIHNSLKHAQATKITLAVKMLDKKIIATITDNGKGFDIASAKGNGNGLYNYEKRMKELGGKVSIQSSNSGTEVQFLITI